MSEHIELSEDDIKALADYFSVLIEIEQDLKNKAVNDQTNDTSNN